MSFSHLPTFDIMELVGERVNEIRLIQKGKAFHKKHFMDTLLDILTSNIPYYYYLDGLGNQCPYYLCEDFDI